jgi:hypothetical protein
VRERDRLDLLTRKAVRRVVRLRLLAEANTPVAPAEWCAHHERALSYVVIEAANLWATFARAHYVSTALRARIMPATRIELAGGLRIRTVEEALTVAVVRADQSKAGLTGPWAPRDEPNWPDPGTWQLLIADLQASNLAAVERAANYRPKTLRMLMRMRNYFAHKSARAGRSARRMPREYGYPNDLHPVLFLLQPAPGFRQPVLLQWLDDLALTLRLSNPTYVP